VARFRRSYNNGKAFSVQVDDIVTVSEKRMIALMRASLQDVTDIMQQPVAKGGRMRVDTGFLRASGQPSLNGMPQGPTRGEREEPGSYPHDEGAAVTVTLGKMKLGQTFYFGWTAEYARYREIYDGFMERGLSQWQRIVTFHTDTIRKRVKK
jgi:hypothetical protein